MKRTGRHREKQLTSAAVARISAPGRYPDGNALYLQVTESGARSWVQRLMIGGKRVDLGLGSASLVSLKEARELAYQFRRVARDGGDPRELRRKPEVVPTFKAAAEAVHKAMRPTWKNERHGTEWLRSLTDYAYPTIGTRRVDNVTTQDVIALLAPMWLDKAETARRVLQRVKAILDWSHAKGYRPAGLDAAAVRKGLPKQRGRRENHYEALPFDQVPTFVAQLRAGKLSQSCRLAFELLILTACRTGEVLLAEPAEFDLEGAVWVVPGARMKMGKEHRVPLAPRAVEIVRAALELGGDRYLFPGQRKGRPLSNMTFLQAVRRLGVRCVPHGFRSSFRDWTAEKTSFPNIVAEAALAHAVPDQVEAAYRRGDLFDKRRQLMTAWAQYATSKKAEVVALRQPA